MFTPEDFQPTKPNQEPTFKEINRLRKAGQLEEAWKIGVIEVQEKPNDVYLKGSFFWVCYDYLKLVQTPIQDRGQASGNFRPRDDEMERIDFLLDWIVWLNLTYGSFEYPRLMFLFRKNLEYIPKLVHLLATAQDKLFIEEDKQPYQGKYGELSSLMLGSARQLAKAWLEFGNVYALDVESVLRFLDVTRKQVKDKKNLIWLDYDEAKCFIKAQRYDDARKFVIPVLKKKKNESWAWGALAATYLKQDQTTAIKLFAEGLSHAHDEKFALKLLKGLAPLLARAGHENEASMCVKRALTCYEENGWRIKDDLQRMIDSDWYNSMCDLQEMSSFIEGARRGAEELLYGELSQAAGLVMNLHQSGKGCHIYLRPGVVVSSPFGNFTDRKPKLADFVIVKYSGSIEELKIRSVEVTENADVPGLEYFTGELRIHAKGFGFVDDTFIPPGLFEPSSDGKKVKVLRFEDLDKTKNKLGWKAATLELIN
jgi:tetratricopeptide (TPR) repeat protein